MGIVVCAGMLLGLLALIFQAKPHSQTGSDRSIQRLVKSCVSCGLLMLGLWNSLWYGLSHFDVFWGKAALVSGLFMILASIILVAELVDAVKKPSRSAGQQILKRCARLLVSLRGLIVIGLAASFLLYCTTLVQLNLGYAIIQ